MSLASKRIGVSKRYSKDKFILKYNFYSKIYTELFDDFPKNNFIHELTFYRKYLKFIDKDICINSDFHLWNFNIEKISEGLRESLNNEKIKILVFPDGASLYQLYSNNNYIWIIEELLKNEFVNSKIQILIAGKNHLNEFDFSNIKKHKN